jgi:hypothetical protein
MLDLTNPERVHDLNNLLSAPFVVSTLRNGELPLEGTLATQVGHVDMHLAYFSTVDEYVIESHKSLCYIIETIRTGLPVEVMTVVKTLKDSTTDHIYTPATVMEGDWVSVMQNRLTPVYCICYSPSPRSVGKRFNIEMDATLVLTPQVFMEGGYHDAIADAIHDLIQDDRRPVGSLTP